MFERGVGQTLKYQQDAPVKQIQFFKIPNLNKDTHSVNIAYLCSVDKFA
jgi:hypothetical protein